MAISNATPESLTSGTPQAMEANAVEAEVCYTLDNTSGTIGTPATWTYELLVEYAYAAAGVVGAWHIAGEFAGSVEDTETVSIPVEIPPMATRVRATWVTSPSAQGVAILGQKLA